MRSIDTTKFESKTAAKGECIEWTGAVTRDGHGILQLDGRTMHAHRAAMILAGHQIPPGMVVRHTCDNPRCVRIEHLALGTHADNVRDRVARGRSAAGERNGRAKLTRPQVDEIRKRLRDGRESKTAIAAAYQIDRRAVYQIEHGLTWRSGKKHGRVPESG